MKIKLIQFKCEKCGLNSYFNVDDDFLEHNLPPHIDCVLCGRISYRSAIFKVDFLDSETLINDDDNNYLNLHNKENEFTDKEIKALKKIIKEFKSWASGNFKKKNNKKSRRKK